MDIDVFVSHHTDSSINIVKAIVNQLESYGVRCWYAPRDTVGAYSSSIVKAIRKCKIFLLILNKPASESEHVLSELELVFARITKKEDVSILPFHIADDMEEISLEVQYYIRRRHWIDAMKPPIYRRIEELVDKILLMLNKHIAVSKNKSTDIIAKNQYSIISKIPQTRDIFLGREELLRDICEFFESGKRVLFLEGIGGIGKSELAKQYALANRQKYDNILFLTYSDSLRTLVCDPKMIEINGLNINLEEDSDSFFMRKLQIIRSITNSRTLFIIDNFDVDDDADLKVFIEGSHNIIFTTRNSHPGFSSIKVKEIDNKKVLFEVFEKNYGMSIADEDKIYLMELFSLVDYHTYTIELLAKQMEASFVSAKELLELFRNGQLASQASEHIVGRNSINTAFGHIESLFALSTLSEIEIQILRKLSLVGHDGVPIKYFLKWSVCDSRDIVKQTVLGLIHRSWVRRESSENGFKLSLHPLVSEVIRITDELKPDTVNCRLFLEKIVEDLYKAWFIPVKDNLSIAGCVLSIAEYFSPFPFCAKDKDLLFIWTCFPNFLWQVGRFDDSIRICHVVYETCLQTCGEKSMLTGFVAKALGACYFNSSREQESISWYMQGLRSMQLSGELENSELALAYEKVARCYTWKYIQDFRKAEEYFQKALSMRENIKKGLKSGQNFICVGKWQECTIEKIEESIAGMYMEMGRMYQCKSDYPMALAYADKARIIYENINPENVSSISYTYYDMGVCYYHLGVNENIIENKQDAQNLFILAEKNLKIALESNLDMRGKWAIDTIDNVEYLADTYVAQGKFGEASNNYMLVLTMLESLFGETHERINIIKKKMDFNI